MGLGRDPNPGRQTAWTEKEESPANLKGAGQDRGLPSRRSKPSPVESAGRDDRASEVYKGVPAPQLRAQLGVGRGHLCRGGELGAPSFPVHHGDVEHSGRIGGDGRCLKRGPRTQAGCVTHHGLSTGVHRESRALSETETSPFSHPSGWQHENGRNRTVLMERTSFAPKASSNPCQADAAVRDQLGQSAGIDRGTVPACCPHPMGQSR